MAGPRKCPQCGAEISPQTPGGHCVACLLKLGIPESANAAALQRGDQVGRYVLREKIGEGGCGVVFLAEQEEPVHREVALKIIKPGMDTFEVITRFEAERQLLALLDHPNIAKIFDAGATDSGHPYFVMELVRGIKITDYCDQQRLSTRERLELFIPICQAIQHAHQKGIIHRDLKPSNVLVTPGADGSPPAPRIIDFGIAKFIGPQLTGQTPLLALQQFMGTPAYMSPEQTALDGANVDARSDIYSLGALLYELLTGSAPFEAAELRRFALDQVLRFIRETEPPIPSARLDKLTPPELNTIAGCRQIEPARLPRLLRGDLDWIIMKCVEKNPARRYETASSLATDLQHHLAHKPVAARPPSHTYRLQKLLRRHRLAFAAAGVIALTLAIGAAISARLFLQKKEADRNTKLAEARSLSNLGAALWSQGNYSAAEARYRDVLALRLKYSSDDISGIAIALNNLATVLSSEGRLAEAETINRQALEMDSKSLGADNPAVAIDMANLANILAAQKKFAEAETLDRAVLAIDRKISGDKNPDVPLRLEDLAKDLAAQGKTTEAATVGAEAVTIRNSAK